MSEAENKFVFVKTDESASEHIAAPKYSYWSAVFKKFFSIVNKLDDQFHSGYAYMALVCHDMKKTDEFLKYLRLAVEYNPQEAKTVLGSLFPEGTPVNKYVEYMEGVKES